MKMELGPLAALLAHCSTRRHTAESAVKKDQRRMEKVTDSYAITVYEKRIKSNLASVERWNDWYDALRALLEKA